MHVVVFLVLGFSAVGRTFIIQTGTQFRFRKAKTLMIEELRQEQDLSVNMVLDKGKTLTGKMNEQLKKILTVLENLKNGGETHLTEVRPEAVKQADSEKGMKTSLSDLSSKLDRLRKDHDQIEQTVNGEMKKELKKVLTMVGSFKNGGEAHLTEGRLGAVRQGDKTSAVSFQTVGLKRTRNVSLGENIKFKGIQLNRGHQFNTSTGIFTAPVDWTYMFWASATCTRSGDINVALMIDGQEAVRGYAADQLGYGSGHLTYITRLTKGLKVWIKTVKPSGEFVHGYRYSSYGGTLLHEN